MVEHLLQAGFLLEECGLEELRDHVAKASEHLELLKKHISEARSWDADIRKTDLVWNSLRAKPYKGGFVQAVLDKFDDAYVASWSIMSVLKRCEEEDLNSVFRFFQEVVPTSTQATCLRFSKAIVKMLRGEDSKRDLLEARRATDGSLWCSLTPVAQGARLNVLMRRMTEHVTGNRERQDMPPAQGDLSSGATVPNTSAGDPRTRKNSASVPFPSAVSSSNDGTAWSYVGRAKGRNDTEDTHFTTRSNAGRPQGRDDTTDTQATVQTNPLRLQRQQAAYLQGAVTPVRLGHAAGSRTAARRAVIRSLTAEAITLQMTIAKIQVMIQEHQEWAAQGWRHTGWLQALSMAESGQDIDEDESDEDSIGDRDVSASLLAGECDEDESSDLETR
jgi:hypothetical protein